MLFEKSFSWKHWSFPEKNKFFQNRAKTLKMLSDTTLKTLKVCNKRYSECFWVRGNRFLCFCTKMTTKCIMINIFTFIFINIKKISLQTYFNMNLYLKTLLILNSFILFILHFIHTKIKMISYLLLKAWPGWPWFIHFCNSCNLNDFIPTRYEQKSLSALMTVI